MMAKTASSLPKIYTLSDIEKVTETETFQDDLIQAIEDGFVAISRFHAAPIQTLTPLPEAPSAQTCVKSGFFQNNPYYVIKVASGGAPWENSGLMQVYSQTSGRLEALLFDEGMLTELRTAAVGALAAKLLAPRKINCVGIVGSGVQAHYQLRMLRRVTDCRQVLVWGRTPKKVQAYCAEMEGEWNMKIADKADDLLQKCELVVTTTCAREAVLGISVNDVTAPVKTRLITCIGSDAPGKMELSPKLIEKSHLRVADNPEQSRVRGEFQSWYEEQSKKGLTDELRSLEEVIQNKALHRRDDDDRLIIFDSSGVALQDCVIAQMVYDALRG